MNEFIDREKSVWRFLPFSHHHLWLGRECNSDVRADSDAYVLEKEVCVSFPGGQSSYNTAF